ncbi:monocarboxylate transporter 3 isoform X2 [Ictidomys tridecemlineatus]|uniref:monocarboxylate transporter 3 n=1 Tax=Ictidomys tridecemlineatus TaxID=43179 RepID=UPI00038C57C3|nr:monocarboxylate transporter 3 [Ictidomys tridecemlineatus]XP_021580100.1 monocarboxylate transporter 3 [Ictidomys tridecemlineatus]XP_040134066.1 monocarboxylate transporter 3 [Ictidomys tridecemlineatus]KAG3290954.1 solute carrier family 16 member 8, transcript variant X5 [Ictidomys tridecemlineatus]KAG3290955.1 solute carrier family 16 member 8, transcript variant X4 [Ictidomys tridecemlineatus]KAG3290956.1 solute carrier family 16 member 8, transcript variant X2 [Ictidomys tridecemlineat
MGAGGPRPGVGPPDGGWGWVVLVACFVVTGFAYGFPKAVSVFFRELMRDFGAGYSDTAWVSSIMLAMLYGTGPVSSILVTRFGCRPVMLAGGLLASAGMILASFATRLLELYLTAGVLTGLGLALNFQPSLIMLGLYFERRRPLANGLAAAGSPVFLSALSPLGQLLLELFGWRGGFLLFGGLLLHCCACGAVMRPPPGPGPRPRPRADREEDCAGDAPREAEADAEGTRLRLREAPPGGRTRRRLLDVAVCTDRAFIVYVVTKFLMALGLFVPAILLVNYAKDAGVPDTEAAFLLSIVGFVDIVARPACGALAGLARLRPHVPYLFSLALLANGITDLSSARARSYGTLVAFCIAFGLSYGMVGALQFEVLMAAVGAPRFPSALGLVLLVEAVAVLIGPPSAGRLVDALKNYEIIFYLAGSEVALAGVFMAVATYCCLRRSRDTPPGPTTGGASDTEDAEAEGEPESLPSGTQEPRSLESLEVPSPRAGSVGQEREADPGRSRESV